VQNLAGIDSAVTDLCMREKTRFCVDFFLFTTLRIMFMTCPSVCACIRVCVCVCVCGHDGRGTLQLAAKTVELITSRFCDRLARCAEVSML